MSRNCINAECLIQLNHTQPKLATSEWDAGYQQHPWTQKWPFSLPSVGFLDLWPQSHLSTPRALWAAVLGAWSLEEVVIILGTIINGSSGTILSGEGQFYLPPQIMICLHTEGHWACHTRHSLHTHTYERAPFLHCILYVASEYIPHLARCQVYKLFFPAETYSS